MERQMGHLEKGDQMHGEAIGHMVNGEGKMAAEKLSKAHANWIKWGEAIMKRKLGRSAMEQNRKEVDAVKKHSELVPLALRQFAKTWKKVPTGKSNEKEHIGFANAFRNALKEAHVKKRAKPFKEEELDMFSQAMGLMGFDIYEHKNHPALLEAVGKKMEELRTM